MRQLLVTPRMNWNNFYGNRNMENYVPIPELSELYLPVITEMQEEMKRDLLPIGENQEQQKQMFECFIGLAALFPMQDIGEQGFHIKQSILNQIFCEYPLKHLKIACVEFAKTGEWFPRPKELIERIAGSIKMEEINIKRLDELKSKVIYEKS